jgi:hypothetical protein
MMQIFTVTRNGTPVAVVRARSVEDAVDAARELAVDAGRTLAPFGQWDAREPNDGEMVGWLEHRDDFLIDERIAA